MNLPVEDSGTVREREQKLRCVADNRRSRHASGISIVHSQRTTASEAWCCVESVLQDLKLRVPNSYSETLPLQDPNREGVQRSTAGLNRWGNHILLGCSWQKGLHRQHIYVYQGDKGLWETVPPRRLGVEDQGEDDQLDVRSEFRENLVKRSDRSSEVGVAWGLGVKLSNTNEMASRKRLKNVERKLRRNKDLKI